MPESISKGTPDEAGAASPASCRAVPRTPVVLLPGMMCDERLFAPQRAALDEAFDVRCARFVEGESIEAFAREALECFAPSVGPLDLIGLSMGGIVAMACMAMAPERIGRVVLMDTNARAETEQRRALRAPQIERALNGELDTLLIEEMKPLYLAPVNRSDEALLALVLDMARALGPEVFARQSRALAAREDFRATLAAWRGRVHLLCGEHDALCPPARHREMAALIGQGEPTIIADAGHLPTLEAAEVTSGALLQFLTG